jgi:hypothetical protein
VRGRRPRGRRPARAGRRRTRRTASPLQDPDGAWRYAGGESFLDTAPQGTAYADLVFRLSEKAGGPVSARYVLPGEALDPDGLITLGDDADVGEMAGEAARDGTGDRVRVILFAADESGGDGGDGGAAGGLLTEEEEADGADFFACAAASAAAANGGASVAPESPHQPVSALADALAAAALEGGGAAAASNPAQAAAAAAAVEAMHWEDGLRARLVRAASRRLWADDGVWGGGGEGARAPTPPPPADVDAAWPPSADAWGGAGDAGAPWWGGGGAPSAPLGVPPAASSAGATWGTGAPPGAPASTAPGSSWDETIEPPDAALAVASAALPSSAGSTPTGGRPVGRPGAPPTPLTPVGEAGPGLFGDGGPTTLPARLTPDTRGSVAGLPTHISIFGEDLGADAEAALAAAAAAARESGEGDAAPSSSSAFAGTPGPANAVHRPSRLRSHALPDVTTDLASPAPGASAPRAAPPRARSRAPSDDSPAPPSPASSLGAVAAHRVPASDVRVARRIGEGAFGDVCLATVPTFGRVAVKWLKPTRAPHAAAAFWREAQTLAALNHPHVIRFFGVCVADGGEPAPPRGAPAPATGDVVGIITEFAAGGSLAQYLRATPPPPLLPLRLRAELALGAARGMAYLHAMRVVHLGKKDRGEGRGGEGTGGDDAPHLCPLIPSASDLKPDNLLLDAPPHPDATAPVVKVADFGLARHRWTSYVPSLASISGTLAFLAPEIVADPDRVSDKADVWSFGCVLCEMVARAVPHAGLAPQAIVSGLVMGGLTPDVPADAEPEWVELMLSCWAPRPADRPSFRELADRLAALVDSLSVVAE